MGLNALVANTTGSYNVAIGEEALQARTTGVDNVAVGPGALALGSSGNYNTALGSTAMAFSNGSDNVAVGDGALNAANGDENIGIGQQACLNCSGDNNIAIGEFAGQKVTTGATNILLGQNAGLSITTGSNNIEIATQGTKMDSGVIRLGDAKMQKRTFIAGISGATIAGGAAVMVNNKGQLGVATSSARYKEKIQPMAQSSKVILSLKPVTLRYKKELDPEGIPQFGLVAEEVARVDPDLVVRDESGQPVTVRYEAVNAMLLNEFLDEHKKVEAASAQLEATDSELQRTKSRLEAYGKEIAELKGALAKQAGLLEKVNARMEANAPAARLVESR
jgi:trimeric autotransporter adhesin